MGSLSAVPHSDLGAGRSILGRSDLQYAGGEGMEVLLTHLQQLVLELSSTRNVKRRLTIASCCKMRQGLLVVLVHSVIFRNPL